VHEGKAHRNVATWPQIRWQPRGFFLFPPCERLLGTFVIVDAAEEGDVVVLKGDTPQVRAEIRKAICGLTTKAKSRNALVSRSDLN
jgi:hypothetical protein